MRNLYPFLGHSPQLHSSVVCFPGSRVIGDVTAGEGSSIWFNAVVRGDVHKIRIGKFTNLQDNVTVHAAYQRFSTTIGDYVTIGHGATIHACQIGDRTLIGIGSTILDGVKIGEDCLIAAGAVVPPGMEIPSGSMVMGVPGKIKRRLSTEEKKGIMQNALNYLMYVEKYAIR